LLDLSLFDNLELARALHAESTGLKKIEKFFLPDVLAVQVVVFPISVRVVRFADGQFISFYWNTPFGIAQGYLNRKDNVVSFT